MTSLVEVARGAWPESEADTEPPVLAGFVMSTFSPLAAEAAKRCLTRAHGQPPVAAERGLRTAVIISSATGDASTAAEVARAVDGGRRLGPLLFFQAVPNAVAGYVAARWELGGPVVSLSPGGGPDPVTESLAEGLAMASLLIRDGDADEALIVVAEQALGDGGRDRALAVLVRDSEVNRPKECS
ncbi:beta-ketoacyl synthase chain length factor [Catellatospora paridis]|uniref:beta-ketoacyl synthase chain length factor n=1 Tax=Catellatospora paridis TaxID=1617086 RepID=UPI0012D44A1B|nr:beta-ketoacyl synthase chain length factor [Catellatospora paridis]